MESLIDREFCKSVRQQEQQWRAVRDGAHPDILEFEKRFIKRMTAIGIPMFAHSMVRDAAAQQHLVDTGVSRDSPKDGIWPHKGCAVDLVHSVRAWSLTDEEWRLIGHIGKETAHSAGIKIEWGGDWSSDPEKLGWDPAHWQLAGWRMLMGGFPWPKA